MTSTARFEARLEALQNEIEPAAFASRLATSTGDFDKLSDEMATAVTQSGILGRAVKMALIEHHTVLDDADATILENLTRGIYRLFLNKPIIRKVKAEDLVGWVEIALREIPQTSSSKVSLDGRRDLSNVLTRLFIERRREMCAIIASSRSPAKRATCDLTRAGRM